METGGFRKDVSQTCTLLSMFLQWTSWHLNTTRHSQQNSTHPHHTTSHMAREVHMWWLEAVDAAFSDTASKTVVHLRTPQQFVVLLTNDAERHAGDRPLRIGPSKRDARLPDRDGFRRNWNRDQASNSEKCVRHTRKDIHRLSITRALHVCLHLRVLLEALDQRVLESLTAADHISSTLLMPRASQSLHPQ